MPDLLLFGRSELLAEQSFDVVDIEVRLLEVGVVHEATMQRYRRLDRHLGNFIERPAHLRDRGLSRRRVHDQLADH